MYSGNPSQRKVLQLRLVQTIDGDQFKSSMRSDEIVEQIKALRKVNPRVNLTDRPGTVSPIRRFIIEATKPFLEAHVDLRHEEELTLQMSSVIGLSDLVEDEIIPDPFPMKVIDNIGLDDLRISYYFIHCCVYLFKYILTILKLN